MQVNLVGCEQDNIALHKDEVVQSLFVCSLTVVNLDCSQLANDTAN